MKFYCQKRKSDNTFHYFFESELVMSLCCEKDEITDVEVLECEEGENTHWGYKDLETGGFNFIFDRIDEVKMCDPFSFRHDIADGKGLIVPLLVKELV